MRFSPETFPIILAHEPAPSDEILETCNGVCVKNADGVWILITEHYHTDGTPLVLTVSVGTTEALAEAHGTQLAVNFPCWGCLDSATSDAMVLQTAATTYTLDAGAGGELAVWVAYVSAAVLAAASYDWICARFTGGLAANTASVTYILDRARYQQETPPSAI